MAEQSIARRNRAAFASAAALALVGCGQTQTRKEAFMWECVDNHNPLDCAEAADRTWPDAPEPPTTKGEGE